MVPSSEFDNSVKAVVRRYQTSILNTAIATLVEPINN